MLVSATYGYSSNIGLSDLASARAIFATHLDGEPLTPEHGWPVQDSCCRTCCRLEGPQVGAQHHLPAPPRARLLGAARLPLHRRRLARGALLLPGVTPRRVCPFSPQDIDFRSDFPDDHGFSSFGIAPYPVMSRQSGIWMPSIWGGSTAVGFLAKFARTPHPRQLAPSSRVPRTRFCTFFSRPTRRLIPPARRGAALEQKKVPIMRSRTAAIAAAVTALVALQPGAAEAATGPKPLQRLAAAQTQLLLSHLKAPLGEQIVSPWRCNEGQSEKGTNGTFLLPTSGGAAGKVSVTCNWVKAHHVLVDLGGFVVTEDKRFKQGSFSRAQRPEAAVHEGEPRTDLRRRPALCAQARTRTSDGRKLTGATRVSTAPFTSRVKPVTKLLYQDSVDLGHPDGSRRPTAGGRPRWR